MRAINKQRLFYFAGDLVACEVATLLFNLARHWRIHIGRVRPFGDWSTDPHVALSYIAFPAVMIAVFALLGFYNAPRLKSRYETVANTAVGAVIGSIIVYFATMVNDSLDDRSIHYSIMAIFWIAFGVPVVLMRLWIRSRLIRKHRDVYNVVIVGSGDDAQKYAERLERNNARMRYCVVAVLDEGSQDSANIDSSSNSFPVISYANLCEMVNRGSVNAFIVLASRREPNQSLIDIKRVNSFGLPVLLPIDYVSIVTSRPRLNNIIGEPLVDITSPGLSPAATNLKRLGDIIASSVALIMLSPVYVGIALMIKLDSKGPVFYRQTRVGRNRRKFRIVKFRTMVENAEPEGPALSSDHDKRITRCGHFLRKYRLDELPQFWNVLRGDMSLVGPRPEREYFLDQIAAVEPSVCTIHNVRPGITSLGMVKYGYASDVDAMVERLYYDLLYVENISFSLDLRILFHTVSTVMTGKGI